MLSDYQYLFSGILLPYPEEIVDANWKVPNQSIGHKEDQNDFKTITLTARSPDLSPTENL